MASVAYPSSASGSSTPTSVASSDSSTPVGKAQFAFAQIKGDVCLVQVSDAAPSALMAADVNVFRHEFITLFRYSHSASVHPADMQILEPIDEAQMLYEEDKGTVSLARDVMARLQKLTLAARQSLYAQTYHCRRTMAAPWGRR